MLDALAPARCHQCNQYLIRVERLFSGAYPPVKNQIGFLRKYLMRTFGERCSRCGWSERNPATGRVMAEIEHIDGNWLNNRPENLTLLCPNCHSLTPTLKNLNRGRGRAQRRARARAEGLQPPNVRR